MTNHDKWQCRVNVAMHNLCTKSDAPVGLVS